MKKKKALEIHNKLEVTRNNDTNTYRSIITGVDKETFSMAIPEEKRIQLRLAIGEKVEITVFTDTTLYKFKTEILGMKKENEAPMYVLKINPNMKKIERRNFFRIDVSLDINYEIIKNSQRRTWTAVNPTNKARTSDLSGGGMQLALDKGLAEDTLMVVCFPIFVDDTEIEIKVLGKVVRSIEDTTTETKYKWRVGVALEEITERQRDCIIKYIFSVMRKKMHLFME
ncbi:c-di-GMP-binding flagellar brake protein YcgR, contains PilZNR and PilZ domains [Desulfonispora thiosulfatigenes DSM 11270]|uniref:C-di-GMP-binding flagellar brake protein YcgR, contains PilZNR and PilZ domains n=1 Tax=Desulfonispora thiosulfatigenes DSM 11270 TaxID=656914 RepID=A0A1W1UMD0_DESTI|nr:PilZ domain-containing protein [Desulfonispora thiosulfatigenes]SMB82295.1 c-di-GMP-binding flagellar brake protein YcgR, contains PilZNR and PilZ domains [Desulfonispora thiosulfatigenes DSM 11270]